MRIISWEESEFTFYQMKACFKKCFNFLSREVPIIQTAIHSPYTYNYNYTMILLLLALLFDALIFERPREESH
jgi:hypothetical protein